MRPIVFIGAGDVVASAHVPAYRMIGLPMRGFFDVDLARAREMARRVRGTSAFASLRDAAAEAGVIFDVAVPADQILRVLRALPDRAVVLIQKPLGRDLAEARKIARIAHKKHLVAAVNLQLRFSPNVLALRDALARKMLGRIVDLEVRTITYTPWQRWTFLAQIPRMEVLYHSIHALDLLRALAGDPLDVRGLAMPDPRFPKHADTRSAFVLRFANGVRGSVHTLHSHEHRGRGCARSELFVSGTRGDARLKMGVNLDYPRGEPDELHFAERNGPWRAAKLSGSWFPCAFASRMSNLQRFAAGEDAALESDLPDALRTMALVEACYRSSASPGTRLPRI